MPLLDDLYPSLKQEASDDIPIWQNPEKPWEVLSEGENGIMNQIIRITGNPQGNSQQN